MRIMGGGFYERFLVLFFKMGKDVCKPQVQPGLVKARLPLQPSSSRDERRKQLLECRDGEGYVGKRATPPGLRPSGEASLRQPARELGKHLTSSVLLPSSSLPSWETDQKPEGKEA